MFKILFKKSNQVLHLSNQFSVNFAHVLKITKPFSLKKYLICNKKKFCQEFYEKLIN